MAANTIPIEDDPFYDTERMEAAMKRAVRRELLMHARLGHQIAIWKNGRTVIVEPEDIENELAEADRLAATEKLEWVTIEG